MALNYSHRFSEDNLVSPMRFVDGYVMEGVPDTNGEGYVWPWYMAQGDIGECDFSCGGNRGDFCSSQDTASGDIVDLLPSDPFGMDIESTFTAITGWLADLEADYGEYVMADDGTIGQGGYGLFAGWDLIWSNSLGVQPFCDTIQLTEQLNREFRPNNIQTYDLSTVEMTEKLNTISTVEDVGTGAVLAPSDIIFQQDCDVGDIVDFSNGSARCSSEMASGEKVDGAAKYEGMPHDALFFALSYLGVKDLLSVGMVCKSLLSTVRGDPLLWRTIHIDQPLNERITDDVLVQLAGRAQGNLQCLSLVECPKITDDGLRHVLEANMRLTKLCVPGCTRISIDCIVKSIKAFNANKDGGGIEHLRIGGLFGVNHEHFKELQFLIGADEKKHGRVHKPHFYHQGKFYLPCDDQRAIDIEMCPSCEKIRLVYDCPAEGCKIRDKSPQGCRACTLCISRCAQCGRCINDTEFEETFNLDLLCWGCYKQLHKYEDKLDKRVVDPHGAVRGPTYDFRIHG